MKPWKILQSTPILQSPYVRLRRDEVELPDGSLLPDYYVMEENDFGMVFALTDANEVVMVRQYKHGIGEILTELPAGYFDDDATDPVEECLREFREETGYSTTWHTIIGTHISHPTRSSNRGHVLVGTGAHLVTTQHLDPAENIEVLLIPVDDVFAMIRRGEITAVSTIASVFMAWDYLSRRTESV